MTDVARSALECGGMTPLSKFLMAKAAPWRRTPRRLRRWTLGFAHHIHCVAYYTQNDKALDTVLSGAEPEQAGPAGLLARTLQGSLQMLGREAGLAADRTAKSLRVCLWSGTTFSGSVKRL